MLWILWMLWIYFYCIRTTIFAISFSYFVKMWYIHSGNRKLLGQYMYRASGDKLIRLICWIVELKRHRITELPNYSHPFSYFKIAASLSVHKTFHFESCTIAINIWLFWKANFRTPYLYNNIWISSGNADKKKPLQVPYVTSLNQRLPSLGRIQIEIYKYRMMITVETFQEKKMISKEQSCMFSRIHNVTMTRKNGEKDFSEK